MTILEDRFLIRRGLAADLASVNEVPLQGEWVWEMDQGLSDGKFKLKIGDGITRYVDLSYLSTGTDIASDNILSPVEKPVVIRDRDVILAEQTGIDAQAVAFAITTEKTAYDNAVTALTNYLATLTTPVLWSDLTGNTTIVGATFRSEFANVYTTRQALLNKIYASAQALANGAQTTGNIAIENAAAAEANASAAAGAAASAQASANAANNELDAIASNGILSPAEKPTVIRDYSVITTEQSGIDAQSVSFLGAGSSSQIDYDNAITALTNYLGGLNSAVAWNDKTGNTTVVATTFDGKFNNVYTTRQTLLNAIYASAKSKADAAHAAANTAVGLAHSGSSISVFNPLFAVDTSGWSFDYATGFYQENGTNSPIAGTPTYLVRQGQSSAPTTVARNTGGSIAVNPGQGIVAICGLLSLSANSGSEAFSRIRWGDINGNEIATTTANISCGPAGNYLHCVSQAIGHAPAGAVVARLEIEYVNHTGGYYTATQCSLSIIPSSMDDVPDSVTRFAAVQAGADQTASNTAADFSGRGYFARLNSVDFHDTAFTGKHLGNIADYGSRFAAVQAGADKTGSNTSSDTSHVAGATAASISDGAGRAQAGFDASGYLVSGRNSLDLIGDGGTYGRTVNSYLNGNRPLMNFADAWHTNKNLDYIGDTGTYGRVATPYLNAARPVMNFADTFHSNKTADYIAPTTGRRWAAEDGANVTETRKAADTAHVAGATAASISDGAGRAQLGFDGSGYLVSGRHSLDLLADGTFARPRANQLFNGAISGRSFGANLLSNPNFSKNDGGGANYATVANTRMCDDWTFSPPNASGWCAGYIETSSGATNALLRINTGSVIPANQGYVAAILINAALMDVQPLRSYYLTTKGRWDYSAAIPAGVGLIMRTYVVWLSGDGTYIGESYSDSVTQGVIPASATVTAPAGAQKAQISVRQYIQNTSAAAITISGLIADMRWSSVSLSLITDLASEVSGTLSTQRNLPSVTFGNYGSGWSGLSLSYTSTTTSATISASAATLQAGSVGVAYNASSITVSGTASTTVTYYLYYDDVGLTGGAKTLQATTNQITSLSNDGRVLVSTISVTFPASGTGVGTTSGGCPVREAWVIRRTPDGLEYCRAGDVAVDDCLLLTDGRWGRVSFSQPRLTSCVRVMGECGKSLSCSTTAPLGNIDGSAVLAPDALGEFIQTLRKGGDSDCIASVIELGERWVQHITCEDAFFWTGDDQSCLFAHHNMKQRPL